MRKRILWGCVLFTFVMLVVVPLAWSWMSFPRVVKECHAPDKKSVAEIAVKPNSFAYFVPPLLYFPLTGASVDVIARLRSVHSDETMGEFILTPTEDCVSDAEEAEIEWHSNNSVTFISRNEEKITITFERE